MTMRTLTGTYHKGRLKLDRPLKAERPLRVRVIAEDEPDTEVLTLSDFSFLKTQELLKNCETSFADEVVRERRSAV